jgi:predicted metal-dependent peptidase
MQFSKVIGNIDPNLVAKAAEALSGVFLELGCRYDNTQCASGIGGDPLIFSLLYPIEHVCTLNIPTAATDGRRCYWNPKFVLKQKRMGLRIIAAHEAWHAIYMHPQRFGSRIPKLWNIAVDYIVNNVIMEDFKCRQKDPKVTFKENLGDFLTLEQYAEFLKNPFKGMPGLEDIKTSSVQLPGINEDRDLSDEEKHALEQSEKNIKFYYADPDLSDDMKRPEAIYDYLYSLLPKCPKCGSIGKYKKPSNKKNKSKKSSNKKNEPGSCCDKCDECEGEDSIDIFDIGGTIDQHVDTAESEEKLAKRVSEAIEAAKKMAGTIPAGLEEELGKLTAPKISWQDIIRCRLLKARSGNGHNDWTRFRTRPMFSGLLTPKRKSYFANFGCLLDTSGSMSADDMAFGVSQLCSLDERSEGTIVPADCKIYWDQATKIKRAVASEIAKTKIVGRGGTYFSEFFSDYKDHIGECNFLIVITDGYLLDSDIADMKDPGIDTIWLVTAKSSFKPPFGRVFDLRD